MSNGVSPRSQKSYARFRFTVIDQHGTVSFLGPGHGLKVFAAACSRGAESCRALLELAAEYDPAWTSEVRRGINIFDEHNTSFTSEAFAAQIQAADGEPTIPFRVLDSESRARSMQPSKSGLVLFNLKDKRIVQVQNSYADLRRHGRGRIRSDGRPTRSLFYYRLPDSWQLVP
jgi:hypothetical protein